MKQFYKIKKKRKIFKFKEPCFPDTLSDKFQQIVQKFATLYLILFFSLSFFFFFAKNSFLKTFLLSFRISIRTKKPRNLLLKLTVWNYHLILHSKPLKTLPPKNITQSNTKLSFSVTHFNNFHSLQILLYWSFVP